LFISLKKKGKDINNIKDCTTGRKRLIRPPRKAIFGVEPEKRTADKKSSFVKSCRTGVRPKTPESGWEGRGSVFSQRPHSLKKKGETGGDSNDLLLKIIKHVIGVRRFSTIRGGLLKELRPSRLRLLAGGGEVRKN